MKYTSLIFLVAALPASLMADIIISQGSSGWSYLETADGDDPDDNDSDYDDTWYNPTVSGYTGVTYDGPAFATNGIAPFYYGTIDGFASGTGTPLTLPDSGDRKVTYFYKVIDGGQYGYENLELNALVDDGAVFYLNGQLLATDGVNASSYTFSREADAAGNETTYDPISLIGAPTIKPGLNLLAVSVHQLSDTSSDLGLDIELSGTAIPYSTIVSSGSSGWSYLQITDGEDPAILDTDFDTTWFNPSTTQYAGLNYDGPDFSSGASLPIYYGSVDALSGGTELPDPDTDSGYAFYMYKEIDGGDEGYASLNLSMLADDGAYVYLNGELIARDGVLGDGTFTTLTEGSGDEENYDDIPLVGSPSLRPGTNLLAVSVHQNDYDSSDMGIDLELSAAPVFVTTYSGEWAMLNPIDLNGDGYDPATADADFNTTWYNQSYGGYTRASYDGPAFTGPIASPVQYIIGAGVGPVDGLDSPYTGITSPNSGTRGTAYFLKAFTSNEALDALKLTILADDGAYIYLNGNHVATIGDLPDDASLDTWGQLAASGGDEDIPVETLLLGPDIVTAGENLIAISLHNTTLGSSDLGFQMVLQPAEDLEVLRGPYLQKSGESIMTVRWRTNQEGTSIVRYGDSPTNLTETVTLDNNTTEHIVEITGLEPATKYYYEIETTHAGGNVKMEASDDLSFKTHPVAGTDVPTRIWVVGDSGTTRIEKVEVYEAYLERTGSADTDAWLMLGDNAYGHGTDAEFQAAVFDQFTDLLKDTVFWSCIGNHETDTDDGQPYIDIHTFPTAGESGGVASGSERYYSFDYGNIHFISIDSETDSNRFDLPGGGGMIDWLELDLQATDKDWIIAIFHHGPYTKGSHDSDAKEKHINTRRYITPLLEKYGCDLVLNGHSHVYERSMFINGHHSNFSTNDTSDSSTFNSANVSAGGHVVDAGNGSEVGSVDAAGNFSLTGADGAYEKPVNVGEQGTVYATVGASGHATTWTVEGSDEGSEEFVNPAPHPVHIVNLLLMGSMVIEVDGNTLTAQYLDKDNNIRDDFTIKKDGYYESWINNHSGVTTADFDEDPDSDGIPSGIEYVLAGDALEPDSIILPQLDVSANTLVFSFNRLVESAEDTTQVFEYSTDLEEGEWIQLNITEPKSADVILGEAVGAVQSVNINVSSSVAPDGKLFGRLRVIKN